MYDEIAFYCDFCEKTLYHDQKFCPIANANQTPRYTLWTKCVCFIHTCYDAKAIPPKEPKVGPLITSVIRDETEMLGMVISAYDEFNSRKSDTPTLVGGKFIYLSDVVLYFASMSDNKYHYIVKNGTISAINKMFKLKNRELSKRIRKMKKGYA